MKILLVNTNVINSIGLKKVITTFVDRKVDIISKMELLQSKLEEGRYSHVFISEQILLATSRDIIQHLAKEYPMIKFMIICKSKYNFSDILSNNNPNVYFLEEDTSYNNFQKEIRNFFNIESNRDITFRPDPVLSNGQSKVFEYLISGYRTKQIAESLNIKQNTVSTIKKIIFKKYNAKSVVDLLDYSNNL